MNVTRPLTKMFVGSLAALLLWLGACDFPFETEMFQAAKQNVIDDDPPNAPILGPPEHPSPPDGAAVGDATPQLNWEDIQEAARYHLQISTTPSFSGELVIDDNTFAVSQYPVPVSDPLENRSTYNWRVRVQNSDAVWGEWSEIWDFTVDINLGIPSIPDPTSGSTTIDTTPLLDWDDVSGAHWNHVQVNAASDFSGTTIIDTDHLVSSQFQIEISDLLSDNTPYYWHARVRNEDDVPGDWSDTWILNIDIAAPTPLIFPVDGATLMDTTPVLDWQDVPDAKAYRVQVDAGAATIIDATVSLSQHVLPPTLPDNGHYEWRVRTVNGDDVGGDWSPSQSFDIDIPVPEGPLSPVNGTTVADSRPLLDWEDVPGASAYRIRVVEDSLTIIEETVEQSEHTPASPLTEAGPYSWQVATVNSDAIRGDWSSPEWSFSIQALELTSSNDGDPWRVGSNATINWQAIGVAEVRVELFRNGAWEYIDGGSPIVSDGEMQWTVVGATASDAIVRVSEAGGPLSDQSSVPFEILPRVWYVDSLAPAGGDGTTWSEAYQYVQDGVAAATLGDEVWVKTGTYYRRGTDTTLLGLKAGVAVYGGFAGYESVRGNRDWVNNVTTLNGQGGVYNVVAGAANASLDGFTVTGGTDNTRDGGGLNSSVTGLEIANCSFTNNVSDDGGAVHLSGGSTTFTQCSFDANDAEGGGRGGAVRVLSAAATFSECVFTGNVAHGDTREGWGGAICVEYSTVAVEDCQFESNHAESYSEIGLGGAIYSDDSTVTIENSRFRTNWADDDGFGGAVYNLMSGTSISTKITNSVFVHNFADTSGGAIANEYADLGSGPVT